MPNYSGVALYLNQLFLFVYNAQHVMLIFVPTRKKMPIGIFYRFPRLYVKDSEGM
jgi:hypothetical protein